MKNNAPILEYAIKGDNLNDSNMYKNVGCYYVNKNK